MSTGLDWGGLMRAGLRGLGLKPREFWDLTPAELQLMLGREEVKPPLSRARLMELSRKWPDLRAGADEPSKGQADGRG